MANPTIKIYDCLTDKTIEREMTKDELLQYEVDQLAAAEAKKAKEEAAIAKNALLEKLGITEDEAKLLLS